jgi:O-antigen/teichoic acid export membrane protein
MAAFRKNAVLALLEKGSALVLALGTAMLLLRGLSKEDFATWALFLLVTYILEMARAGLVQNGMVRHLALFRQEAATYAAIKRAGLYLNLGFSLVAYGVFWAAVDWVANTWQAPALRSMLPVFGITNLIAAMLLHFNLIQQAAQSFKGILLASFCSRLAMFVWVAWHAFTATALHLPSLAVAMLAGTALGAVASWFMLRALPQPAPAAIPAGQVTHWMRQLAGYGKWVLGTNLSTMFYKSADKLVLGYLIGPAAFAVYDAAGKVTQLVEAPSFSIASVVFPQSAERMALEGQSGIKWLYERSVGAILAIILPFLALILLFPKTIMVCFAGPEYLESSGILVITAFFGLFLPFTVQFGTIFDATGRPAINFACTFFTALFNLSLSWWLVGKCGVTGAAWATLTGYAGNFVVTQWLLYRNFGINALQAFRYVPEFYRLGWAMVAKRLTTVQPGAIR